MKNFKNLSKKEKAEYIAILVLYPFFLLYARLGKVFNIFSTKRRQIVASTLSFAMVVTMIPVLALTAFADSGNGFAISFGGKTNTYDSFDKAWDYVSTD